MVDPNLVVYAKASFVTVLKQLCDDLEIKFTLDILDSVAELESSDYLNVRISPIITPMSWNQNKIHVDVVILLHYVLDSDIYRLEKLKGPIFQTLNGCIPLKVMGSLDATEEALDIFRMTSANVRVFDMQNQDRASRARESVFIAQYETTISQET